MHSWGPSSTPRVHRGYSSMRGAPGSRNTGHESLAGHTALVTGAAGDIGGTAAFVWTGRGRSDRHRPSPATERLQATSRRAAKPAPGRPDCFCRVRHHRRCSYQGGNRGQPPPTARRTRSAVQQRRDPRSVHTDALLSPRRCRKGNQCQRRRCDQRPHSGIGPHGRCRWRGRHRQYVLDGRGNRGTKHACLQHLEGSDPGHDNQFAPRILPRTAIRVNSVAPAFIGPGAMWERQIELQAAAGTQYFPSDIAQGGGNDDQYGADAALWLDRRGHQVSCSGCSPTMQAMSQGSTSRSPADRPDDVLVHV